LSWDDPEIQALSLRHLRRLSKDAKRPTHFTVKRWPHGLPCGGSGTLYDQVSDRPPIYLAGDRFSDWPSMSGALESGQCTRESLANAIRAAQSPPV